MNHWKIIYRDRSYLKKKKIFEGPQQLTWQNLAGGISFLCFGMVIAVISFVAELFLQQAKVVHRN
jgi:hypothetical protein